MSQRQNSEGLRDLTVQERSVFPIIFDIDFNYRQIDRVAGFWMSVGLKVTILTTSSAGYILVLDLPD